MARVARMTSSVSAQSAAHGVRGGVGAFEVHRRQLTLKCLDTGAGNCAAGLLNRDGETVPRQPLRDHRPQAPASCPSPKLRRRNLGLTSTGSVHAAYRGCPCRGGGIGCPLESSPDTSAARQAEGGREISAEREPVLTVAQRAGRAPGSARRTGASGSASPAGGGRPGSRLPWPGRACRGRARARCRAARRASSRGSAASAAAQRPPGHADLDPAGPRAGIVLDRPAQSALADVQFVFVSLEPPALQRGHARVEWDVNDPAE